MKGGILPATRWVYLEVKEDKTARSARDFLHNLSQASPIRIQKILTDNGKEFTDRLFSCDEEVSGQHVFDPLCAALGIEHRLTRPRTPQTNGMVERFNGRIADILNTHHFMNGEDLEQTLLRDNSIVRDATAGTLPSFGNRSHRLPTPCRRKQRSMPERDTSGQRNSRTTATKSSSGSRKC
jgi:transposase InsO family protein